MATGKTLVFSNISVNGIAYGLHLTEGVEVTIEPVTDAVEDNQELVSAYDISFSAKMYNTAILNDTNVYTNTANAPTKATVVFTGATGGQTLTVGNVIVNGSRSFDETRGAASISGRKRTTTLGGAVTVA
jgi:hypothetical protein